MRIHEDVETIALCDPQDLDCVLDVLLIVLPRSCVLQSLPSEDVADGVVAPSLQAREVCVCFVDAEWSVDK